MGRALHLQIDEVAVFELRVHIEAGLLAAELGGERNCGLSPFDGLDPVLALQVQHGVQKVNQRRILRKNLLEYGVVSRVKKSVALDFGNQPFKSLFKFFHKKLHVASASLRRQRDLYFVSNYFGVFVFYELPASVPVARRRTINGG